MSLTDGFVCSIVFQNRLYLIGACAACAVVGVWTVLLHKSERAIECVCYSGLQACLSSVPALHWSVPHCYWLRDPCEREWGVWSRQVCIYLSVLPVCLSVWWTIGRQILIHHHHHSSTEHLNHVMPASTVQSHHGCQQVLSHLVSRQMTSSLAYSNFVSLLQLFLQVIAMCSNVLSDL